MDISFPPDRLYKYKRPPSHPSSQPGEHQDPICQGLVYFANPKSMNDDVECQPEWTGHLSEADIVAYIVRTNHRRAGDRQGRVSNLVMRERLRQSEFVPKKWIQTLDFLGVYSLSATPCSRHMWECYGDGHRGYCLEFSDLGRGIVNDRTPAVGPLEVKYVDQRLRRARSGELRHLSVRDDASRDEFFRLLTHKLRKWSLEEEWRLISRGFPVRDRRIKMPTGSLTRIIFGLHCDDDTEATLRAWGAKTARLQYSRVREAPTSSELVLVDA